MNSFYEMRRSRKKKPMVKFPPPKKGGQDCPAQMQTHYEESRTHQIVVN
jgi:hypothetical protein